jgi:hypothetical protein
MTLNTYHGSQEEVNMRLINLTKEGWGLEPVARLEEMWGSLPEEAKTRYLGGVYEEAWSKKSDGCIRGV